MTSEVRRHFGDELDEVRRMIVSLAAMATEAVPRATEALLAGDLEAAQQLIDGDDAIDSLSVQIEERCYRLLVLQNPMASDLRQVVAAMWINAEIERTADLATNICKGTRRIFGTSFEPRVRGLIADMSSEAERLTRLAIDAYADGDAGLASALHDIDDRLDNLHASFVQTLLEGRGATGADLQPAVQLALIGRYYERIGDHAVNIGDRVRYMVDGWMPEHDGAARAAQRAQRPDDQRADDAVEFGAGVATPDPAEPGEE